MKKLIGLAALLALVLFGELQCAPTAIADGTTPPNLIVEGSVPSDAEVMLGMSPDLVCMFSADQTLSWLTCAPLDPDNMAQHFIDPDTGLRIDVADWSHAVALEGLTP